MSNIERGVILREITVRKPSSSLVEIIIRAQAEKPNRMIFAEWQNTKGKTLATITINPNRAKTVKEIQGLSIALGKVERLTVQEILPF